MLTKKILVPVDFSDCSVNALRYAVGIAKKINAELLIMNAFYVPLTHAELGGGAIVHDLAPDVDQDIQENFKTLIHQVPELEEVNYETIIKHTRMVDAVTSLSSNVATYMIIMGTKGATGLDEVIMGTDTYKIIKEVKTPVLAVPHHKKFSNIKKIALACDYKFMNETTLSPLTLIAHLFGAEIHIFHVNDAPNLSSEEAEQAKKFERYFKNIRHHYSLVVNNDVENGVEEYIRKNKIDLLALVPRKHNLFDRIFGKGESRSIIFHAQLPILVLSE